MIDQRRNKEPGGGQTSTRSKKSGGDEAALDLGEELGALQHDARALFDTLQRTGDGFAKTVEEQVKARPHVALGIGVGVGYVLGGGLPTFVSKALLRMGFRAAMSFAVARVLANIAGEANEG